MPSFVVSGAFANTLLLYADFSCDTVGAPKPGAASDMTDVFALAALYCVAIARGHAFLDANKRTAVNCTWAFLKMNGVKTSVPENLVETVIRTATGEMDAQKAAEYLRAAFGEK